VDSDRTTAIGDLAPAESRTVSVSLAFGANSDAIKIPTAAGYRTIPLPNDPLADTPEAVSAKLRYAVTQAMVPGDQNNNAYAYGYGDLQSNFGKSPNMIVGWLDAPLFRPTVYGRVPTGEEVNLVCVHLPAPTHASKPIAAGYNPFVSEPILNLQDNVGPGGVGRSLIRGNE
jgi:hypothetical protein